MLELPGNGSFDGGTGEGRAVVEEVVHSAGRGRLSGGSEEEAKEKDGLVEAVHVQLE